MPTIDRAHDRSRQRCHGDRHPDAEHDDRGKERRPIRTADRRTREQGQAERADGGPDGERQTASHTLNEPARPARHREHDDRERQERRPGLGG